MSPSEEHTWVIANWRGQGWGWSCAGNCNEENQNISANVSWPRWPCGAIQETDSSPAARFPGNFGSRLRLHEPQKEPPHRSPSPVWIRRLNSSCDETVGPAESATGGLMMSITEQWSQVNSFPFWVRSNLPCKGEQVTVTYRQKQPSPASRSLLYFLFLVYSSFTETIFTLLPRGHIQMRSSLTTRPSCTPLTLCTICRQSVTGTLHIWFIKFSCDPVQNLMCRFSSWEQVCAAPSSAALTFFCL